MKYTVQFHVLVELEANNSVEAENKLAKVLPDSKEFDALGKTLSRGWNTNLLDDTEEPEI